MLSEEELMNNAVARVARRDRRALEQRVAGLRNLAESMRRDAKWRVSAMTVFEAAWTIESLLEALMPAEAERTGA